MLRLTDRMLRPSRKIKRRIFAALSINITCPFSAPKYADVNKTGGSILNANYPLKWVNFACLFTSPEEIGRLGDALTAAERDGVNIFALAAIKLLLLTGCRKLEILTLQWNAVDFANSFLRLADSKTGKKDVPLGLPAIELLESLPRLEGNLYVIPGTKPGGHFVGLPKIWNRLRNQAELDWATPPVSGKLSAALLFSIFQVGGIGH